MPIIISYDLEGAGTDDRNRIQSMFERFGFERIRDVYDRTEKYLVSEEQDRARGRVLVVLINSLPESGLRKDLLDVVLMEADLDQVADYAATLLTNESGATPGVAPSLTGFSGTFALSVLDGYHPFAPGGA